MPKDVYEFDYRGVVSQAKFLYASEEFIVLFECKDYMNEGICPEADANFYILGRKYTRNETVLERLKSEIESRTYDCYEYSNIMWIPQSNCPEGVPIGKTSCTLADIDEVHALREEALTGRFILAITQ